MSRAVVIIILALLCLFGFEAARSADLNHARSRATRTS